MRPRDLIKTARSLVPDGPGQPRQSDLRRALSTAYYAAFHRLARSCADLLVGSSANNRSKHAWRQVYRSLEHGFSKNACSDAGVIEQFPSAIQDFANTFVELQEKRHKADYDPFERLTRSGVLSDIDRVEDAITEFKKVDKKDQRAFCTFVLFKKRR